MVEKHKMSKDQQTFIGVTFATIQSIWLFHWKTTRKVAKGIKNKIMQLMDMGKLTIMTKNPGTDQLQNYLHAEIKLRHN